MQDKAKDLFSQYHLSEIPDLNLSPTLVEHKIPCLLEGTLAKRSLKIYKGKKDFYRDLQTIF